MQDLIFYDPLLFKFPKGVVKKGQTVEFEVQVRNSQTVDAKVFLCVKQDGDNFYREFEMKKNEKCWSVSHEFCEAGHYFYHFKVFFENNLRFLCKTFNNYSCLLEWQGEDFFQSVLEEEYTCTNSLQGGLIYQIYADRFCKVGESPMREPLIFREDWGGVIKKNTTNPIIINQEVFGGNLAGVISKLDYLKQLGVTVIYFNPISMANSNHKYDTADYSKVDPMLGGDKVFKQLVDEANARNIKIVIDGVYNHTGSDSVYFNKESRFDSVGAYNSKNSKYYSWYDFQEYPNKYSSWWGIDTLPAIKDNTGEFENYIAGDCGVIEKFMKLGVFGFRLDVVDEIDDDFVKKISNKIHEFGKDAAVIGEVWEDASTKISYSKRRKYFVNGELNSVMNYPIKESILNYIRSKEPNDLVSTIRMLQNNYPKAVQDNLMNFLGTHDTSRVFSELKIMANGDNELATKYLQICFVLLMTLSGVPSIFYGDEYGMENNDGSSRGCFDWQNYDNDIFKWITNLTKIRKLSVLKNGELNILFSQNGKFVFERKSKLERIVVGINLKNDPLKFLISGNFENYFTKKKQNNFCLNENEWIILIDKK